MTLNWFQVSTDESDTLQSLLTKKEADMKEMEDKYRKYLEKAKTVNEHSMLKCHHIISYRTGTLLRAETSQS